MQFKKTGGKHQFSGWYVRYSEDTACRHSRVLVEISTETAAGKLQVFENFISERDLTKTNRRSRYLN